MQLPKGFDSFESFLTQSILLTLGEVKACVENHRVDVNIQGLDGITPLHNACKNEFFDIKIIKYLISNGAKINAQNALGETPLHLAAKSNNLELVECLIENGADSTIESVYGDAISYSFSSAEIFNRLNKLSPRKAKDELLLQAAYGKSDQVIEQLLNDGANIDCMDEHGRTPLHRSIEMENYKVVNCLIKKGANLNVVDIHECSLLQTARRNNGSKKIIDLLLKKGAYEKLQKFGRKLLIAKDPKKKSGIIDQNGKIILSIEYEKIEIFKGNSFARILLNGKWGVVDEIGNIILPIEYNEICYRDEENLFEVNTKDKWGIIDITAKIVIPIKYNAIGYFFEDMAWVELNDKRGFVNKSGEEVIPLKYDFTKDFRDNRAEVKLSDTWFFIDREGNEVI